MAMPTFEEHYQLCLDNGCSTELAYMLASRKFPGIAGTDSIFNAGKFQGTNGIDAEERWLRQRAERSGVSTTGKWYCRGLAEYPGDPRAWIDGAGDVKRIAEERNYSVSGMVNHRAHEVEPMPDIPVAPELVENRVNMMMEDNPGADRAELTSMMYDVMAPKEVPYSPEPLGSRLAKEFAKEGITYDQIEASCKE